MEKLIDGLDPDKVLEAAREMGIEVLSPGDGGYVGHHTIAGEKIDLDDVLETMRHSGDTKH